MPQQERHQAGNKIENNTRLVQSPQVLGLPETEYPKLITNPQKIVLHLERSRQSIFTSKLALQIFYSSSSIVKIVCRDSDAKHLQKV
eukprot:10577334-Ditylum_brightwellii.AAC.1